MIRSHTLQRIFLTVWSPSRTFEEVRQHPAWFGPFLVVSLGAAAITFVTVPVFQKMFLLSLTEPLSPDQLELVTRIQRLVWYFSVGGAFLGTLLSGLISAFLIWLIIQVFEGLADFKLVFSVIIHASLVSLISGVLVTALVLVKAQAGAVDLQDLDIRLGADLFVGREVHPALKVLLANLNPFSLWYYWLLTIGVGRVCDFNRRRSAWVVGVFWAICIAFGVGIAWVIASMMPPKPSL